MKKSVPGDHVAYWRSVYLLVLDWLPIGGRFFLFAVMWLVVCGCGCPDYCSLVTWLLAGYRVTDCLLLGYWLPGYLVTYWLPNRSEVKECCDGAFYLPRGLWFHRWLLVAGYWLVAG